METEMKDAPALDGAQQTFIEFLNENGYTNIKAMQDGTCCAIQRQLYTAAIVVGLDRGGYKRRYCYERECDAREALMQWAGAGDPPGPWIKEKPSDRLGPGATDE
jgi:hypothetical protein